MIPAQAPPASTAHSLLSTSRISKFMSGDVQTATKMNIFDKFLDLFRPSSKEAALKNLYQMLEDSGTSNFARFSAISQMASESSKFLFTVHITPLPSQDNQYSIQYCINGESIKTDVIDQHEKDSIARTMGKPLDAATVSEQMTSIDHQRVDTSHLTDSVEDKDFAGGGVNKKFHPATGLLRADTATGTEDFDREQALAEYAQDRHELASYISTQKKIACPAKLNPQRSYAIVDVYDKQHVASTEMDRCLEKLSREQAKSLLPQMLDMLKVLYQNEVAHRDLHMHNLVIHELKDSGSVHLKAIDFGRLAMAADFEKKKFEDIDYMFSKQGSTLLETFGRNYLTREGSEVDEKHYPIHKLCKKFNEKGIPLDATLAKIGADLKAELKLAGKDLALSSLAFNRASDTLQQLFAQLTPHQMGIVYA